MVRITVDLDPADRRALKIAAAETPIRNAQQKVTGYKVSAAVPADGYVLWTNHATFDCTDWPGVSWERNMTSRWPVSIAGSGVSDVKVDGKAVTVTPRRWIVTGPAGPSW